MKNIDEFQSVLVIASLILAACAILDLPVAVSAAGAASHATYALRQAAQLATPDSSDVAGSRAAREPGSAVHLTANQSLSHSPGLQVRRPLQARSSW
jgi:hypothetical protein